MKNIISNWDKRPVVGIVAVVAFAIGAWGYLSNGPFVGSGINNCASDPLRHVYSSQRLQVLATCQHIHFKVAAYRKEHDGDYHVDGVVSGGGWTNEANVRGQHGYTVVEFTPWDSKPKKFFVNQELELVVTKVYDQQHKQKQEPHGWIEGHPAYAFKDVTPVAIKPGLNRPSIVTKEDEHQGPNDLPTLP